MSMEDVRESVNRHNALCAYRALVEGAKRRGSWDAEYGEYDKSVDCNFTEDGQTYASVYRAAYYEERERIEWAEKQKREREEEQRRWASLTPEEREAELAEKRRKRKFIFYTLFAFVIFGILRRLIVNIMHGNGFSLAKFE